MIQAEKTSKRKEQEYEKVFKGPLEYNKRLYWQV